MSGNVTAAADLREGVVDGTHAARGSGHEDMAKTREFVHRHGRRF